MRLHVPSNGPERAQCRQRSASQKRDRTILICPRAPLLREMSRKFSDFLRGAGSYFQQRRYWGTEGFQNETRCWMQMGRMFA